MWLCNIFLCFLKVLFKHKIKNLSDYFIFNSFSNLKKGKLQVIICGHLYGAPSFIKVYINYTFNIIAKVSYISKAFYHSTLNKTSKAVFWWPGHEENNLFISGFPFIKESTSINEKSVQLRKFSFNPSLSVTIFYKIRSHFFEKNSHSYRLA